MIRLSNVVSGANGFVLRILARMNGQRARFPSHHHIPFAIILRRANSFLLGSSLGNEPNEPGCGAGRGYDTDSRKFVSLGNVVFVTFNYRLGPWDSLCCRHSRVRTATPRATGLAMKTDFTVDHRCEFWKATTLTR